MSYRNNKDKEKVIEIEPFEIGISQNPKNSEYLNLQNQNFQKGLNYGISNLKMEKFLILIST